MEKTINLQLSKLFCGWANCDTCNIEELPESGSNRKYYRISENNKSAIAVFNTDKKENIAFLKFTEQFQKYNLPVPAVFAEDLENNIYLQEDLGNLTLFDFITEQREKHGFGEEIISVYKKIIKKLPAFQITASNDFNYNHCYPRESFDKQSMLWDLNYFKYYFLKLAKISFDEQKLENDFETFTKYLLKAKSDYFLYRDFQSRNIMLVNGEPYFIDYQGGRKGALQYDITSLLYDAKADIPQNVRNELLEFYIDEISKYEPINKKEFLVYYYGFVFIRISQALGAYGFRGFYERKEHFLLSIPYALQNLEWLLDNTQLEIEIPELYTTWVKLVESPYLKQFGKHTTRLTIRVQSFSYKRGIPVDEKGNGGGFVFDCRALPNPGRLPEFKNSTGNDANVIAFLGDLPILEEYLNNCFALVDYAVENYIQRNFSDLLITFGCTGGQHRSVFCANMLAAQIKDKYNIKVEVRHREQEMKVG